MEGRDQVGEEESQAVSQVEGPMNCGYTWAGGLAAPCEWCGSSSGLHPGDGWIQEPGREGVHWAAVSAQVPGYGPRSEGGLSARRSTALEMGHL